MLPRSQRSIFHLGEEGGDAVDADAGHRDDDDGVISIHHQRLRADHGRGGAVVGLRIVFAQKHQQNHGGDGARPCRVVLKQMVWPARRRRRPCGFLRACSLCRRELSPDKDVYMYRGDQGFCSEECRWKQIMKDEAREQDAMAKKERRGLHHHHRHYHHAPPRLTPAIRSGSPARLLCKILWTSVCFKKLDERRDKRYRVI